MAPLIDTHSHLYLDQFCADIEEVIQRARNENVVAVVLPNIDSSTVHPLHELVSAYSGYFIPLMGLHPTHVKENYKEELEFILGQFEQFNYKGIGEIGIDLYWDKTFYQEQVNVFEYQLQLAKQNDLPVVIHSRESFNEIMQILKKKKYEGLKGIFHAYTGDVVLAREITGMGFKLGIGGILTFKNSGLPEIVGQVDINHIVVETDSPYLAPDPFRGKRNESSYLKYIVQKLAEIKNISADEVAEITTRNAIDVFGL
ncbi:MAG: TatD family hydrolase [Bacteroidales bacterium]|jgi:TatD DNase family protein